MNDTREHTIHPNEKHVDELTAMLFLEAQLKDRHAQQVAAHIAQCAACAALLQAMKQETLAFSQALQEEDEPLPAALRAEALRDARPSLTSRGVATRDLASRGPALPPRASEPARAPSPRPTWALQAWALAFGVLAAASFIAWTDILAPWMDQLDQLGIQGSNLLLRLLFTAVFWEGWTTMFDTLQYAVWILLGVSALMLLRGRLRKPAGLAALVAGLAMFLAIPAPASAAEVRRGPDITVPAGETVNNDLIAMGARVLVDGNVNGDLIAFTQNLAVNGHVTGDVIVFGDSARLAGTVDGNVRCFCNNVTLESSVGKNFTAFAARVELNPGSTIHGGVIGFARSILADGKVDRDLLLFSADTSVNGSVGGDVWLRGGRLSVGPTAAIAGRLQVRSNSRPDVPAGARLGQPLEFQFVQPRPNRFRFTGFYLLRQIVSYAVAFLCGLLLIKLFPGLFVAARDAARHVGLSMSIGALVLVSGFALLIFSIVLLIAGAAAGVATLMLYAPFLYGSQVFVGAWLGEKVLGERIRGESAGGKTAGDATGAGTLAVGLLILRVLGLIPFLGFFVWMAILLWGTGAICVGMWNRTRLDVPTAVAA